MNENMNEKLNENNIENIDENIAAKADELIEKYDKETGKMRKLVGTEAKILAAVAILMAAFHLYTAGFGLLLANHQRAIHLAFVFVIGFLLYPMNVKKKRNRFEILDIIFAIIGVICCIYVVVNFKANVMKAGNLLPIDYVLGTACILLVLEVTRRTIGPELPIVAIIFLMYGYFGRYMPGLFAHRGFPVERIINQMFLTTEGIFGAPLGVSATFVILFVLFGAFLEKTGIGRVFIDIAFAFTGKMRGGPAKAAVVASGFMGSISGSSTANVVTTGIFTIPLMKKVGYKPHFAGAVEAAASTGGQILPPVMGAAAFVMSEFTGISYIKIIISAAIPALLYYLSVGIMVHLEACKLGLKGLKEEELPSAKETLKKGWHLFLPVVVIVFFLVKGMTPLLSAFYGIISILLVSAISKETRIGLSGILEAMASGAKNAVGVAAACATAGIVVGIVTMSGLGLKLGSAIVALSMGNLFLTLFFVMVASIILGMGLPTTAKYIVLATMAVPALVQLGVPLMAAHLFVLYFGIVADITPPVALAAYAGAGIAEANPMRTGFTAVRLATAGFVIPYIFAYSPALLLLDTTIPEAVMVTVTACVGVYALAGAIQNYLLTDNNILERIMLAVAAVTMIKPGLYTDIVGFGLLFAVIFMQKNRQKRVNVPVVK